MAISLPPSEPTELGDGAEPRNNANVTHRDWSGPKLLQLYGGDRLTVTFRHSHTKSK